MSERERERDRRRLDKLLDAWERELETEPSAEVLALASKAVVSLLERRSRLLGLDTEPGQDDTGKSAESPIKRILAAVPKAGGG